MWDLLRGRPEAGEGPALEELPATPWLIERWQGFYPEGPIRRAP
jgi:hypothetical protein